MGEASPPTMACLRNLGSLNMTATAYNRKQLAKGQITDPMVTTMVEFWQEHHGLEIDGYCGPATQASIIKDIFGDDAQSALALEALKVAIEEIGHGEEGGNNSGPHVAKYHGIQDDHDPDDDGSWCSSFCSWAYEEAGRRLGVTLPFQRSGGAKRLFKNVVSTGKVVSNPLPGDLVLWDRGLVGSWQGHIAIVEAVENGVLLTIEGNVGKYPAKVRRLSHDLGRQHRLEGFARIAEIHHG